MLTEKRKSATAASVHATMLQSAKGALFSGPTVSFDAAVDLHKELEIRFDALPFEQRRILAMDLISVTVMPGRTPPVIWHKVVTSLNPDEWGEHEDDDEEGVRP